MSLKSKRWQRDRIVTGILCTSVVAKMKTTCGGRLLERLEERVERVRREHVHLVDDVDLHARARRRVAHALEHRLRLLDLRVRGGVDLDDVDRAPARDLLALLALAAGLGRGPLLAAQRLREDARRARLADAARAREQERVVDAVLLDGVRERARDVLLSHEVGEPLRAVLAREHEIGHEPGQSTSLVATVSVVTIASAT